jgi:hypothetical protein
MKKLLLTLALLLSFTPVFAQSDFNSKLDLSIFYHPSFDLSGDAELPMRSSMGTRLLLTPISYNINNFGISLNTGIMFVSDSLTYNNVKMRGYSGFDLDLGLDYRFNNLFQTKLLIGAGELQLGEQDLIEAYFIGSIIPSFNIYEDYSALITITSPINVIYRKQLISTTFGIGINIQLKWVDEYIKE